MLSFTLLPEEVALSGSDKKICFSYVCNEVLYQFFDISKKYNWKSRQLLTIALIRMKVHIHQFDGPVKIKSGRSKIKNPNNYNMCEKSHIQIVFLCD